MDRLVVESAEPREVPCVYKTALKEHKDEQRFADDFMRFVHAFSEPLWQRAVADRPADEVRSSPLPRRVHVRSQRLGG